METAALEVRVAQLETEIQQVKTNCSKDHHEIYDRLRALETESAVSAERYKNIMSELETQKEQLGQIILSIDDLSGKPGKRWETAVTGLISGTVGTVVGFLAQKLA